MLGGRGAHRRGNTWGTSAAHQERSCSPHVARGTSSGSSSCDAGAACRNPVVHPRKQPGYAGQPAAEGSARGSKPASGSMVANRSAAVAAAACRRMLRRTNMQCARRRRHAGGEDSAHGRGVLVHAQLSRHVALSCTITTALARAARAWPLHGSAHPATQAEPVASRGSARPLGAHPRQSNHHHTVTPSHRVLNLISHFGGRGLRPSRRTVTLPIYNNFTFSIVVKDGVTV